MKLLNQILRGVVIGVANIIPGVSGGTMMVSMGIYDTLIHCITHLFSEFKQSIKTLLPYAIGMVLGIVVLASVLEFLFDTYPLPTYTAFIGLILGGLSPLIKKVDRKKLNAVSIAAFVLFFALIVVMALTGDVTNPETLDLNVGQVLLLVVIGWVFFFSDSVGMALGWLGRRFDGGSFLDGAAKYYWGGAWLVLLVSTLASFPVCSAVGSHLLRRRRSGLVLSVLWFLLLLLLCIASMMNDTYSTFLYFQF